METQKGRLKANQVDAVLEALAPCLETGYEGPVSDCDRYLRNRLSQLDYQGALEKGVADWLGGNRMRTPLCDPGAAQVARSLVDGNECRGHVGVAHQSCERGI